MKARILGCQICKTDARSSDVHGDFIKFLVVSKVKDTENNKEKVREFFHICIDCWMESLSMWEIEE